VQGTSNLLEVPILYFIKFTLGMGDAGGQLFDSLRNGGWFVKPLWGYISDRFPLFGYHRKSWFVLMACGAVVLWMVNALLAYRGVRVPAVYLITLNLALATYAFVDVVCDALMVTWGRRLGCVGSFVNFQWAVLATANAGAIMLGGWLQSRVQAGAVAPWFIFFLTGLPPLFTAWVGLRNIDEARVTRGERRRRAGALRRLRERSARALRNARPRFRDFRRDNRALWLLVLFLFFWRFSPSVGFIERSYLIDVRGFTALSFGVILSVGSLVFLASIFVYITVIRWFRAVAWYHYLYAMVVLGVLSFPLSFFLYLDPDHAWWRWFNVSLPTWLNPLPEWNRYQWFRLLFQAVLGFATIPAFLIPLTIAGETIKVRYAGVSYAFLMSLVNVTNLFEGVVGAGLYQLLMRPRMEGAIGAFGNSVLNIAKTDDPRTLVLQLFVYISLFFTLLTVPFLRLLKRELSRQGISIELGAPRD